jgi:hypothetical protein
VEHTEPRPGVEGNCARSPGRPDQGSKFAIGALPGLGVLPAPELDFKADLRSVFFKLFFEILEKAGFSNPIFSIPAAQVAQIDEEILERAEVLLGSFARVVVPVVP